MFLGILLHPASLCVRDIELLLVFRRAQYRSVVQQVQPPHVVILVFVVLHIANALAYKTDALSDRIGPVRSPRAEQADSPRLLRGQDRESVREVSVEGELKYVVAVLF